MYAIHISPGYVSNELIYWFQIHKSCLPSHSVYSITMEKIANRLDHPSNDEMLQDNIHKQEVKIKKDLHAQQAVVRT